MNALKSIVSRRTEFGLLVAATVIIAIALITLNLAQGSSIGSEVAWVIGGFIGVFTIAHLALCILAPNADQIMLPVAALLNGLELAGKEIGEARVVINGAGSAGIAIARLLQPLFRLASKRPRRVREPRHVRALGWWLCPGRLWHLQCFRV
mgnify:CR=1 FL=1